MKEVEIKRVDLKIIKLGDVITPKYMTIGSAGADLHANIQNSITLKPFERALVSTGLKMEIPEGYEVQLRPRSGLAYKQGVTLLNTPGTIDSDYRGEIKVLLINLSKEDVIIEPNDRIAQMVLNKVIQADFKEAKELETSIRGSGGFGHTGKSG